jgi:hypothetical protein
MAKVKLTDRFCATAKATEQTDYFDDDTKGLALRIGGTGGPGLKALRENFPRSPMGTR